jgi:hypothetical protein
MWKLGKLSALSVAVLSLTLATAASARAQAIDVPISASQTNKDVYENTTFLQDGSAIDAEHAVADINAGLQLPFWKGPATKAGANDRFSVTAARLKVADRLFGGLTLTAPAAGQKRYNKHLAVALTPGVRYVIEVQSGTGATEVRNGVPRALPGFFDPQVLVEDERADARGNRPTLAANDDIDWPRNCNSRVTITAPTSGLVRITVTSYNTDESGAYQISIKAAN